MSERDWTEMDSDTPPRDGWSWVVGPRLAHHSHSLSARTREVGWGPDPPVLLESLMGFFTDRSMTDSLNSWYHTRLPGKGYEDEFVWEQIPSQHQMGRAREENLGILYSAGNEPYPHRSKFHGQQYTSTGAMFTYEFGQWKNGRVEGFMRIPVARDFIEEAREMVADLPFEEYQMQTRTYREQYADGPAPSGTFYHPHYRPEPGAAREDFEGLFTAAHDIMRRSVRMEVR